MKSWQPLHTPKLKVSGLAKNCSMACFAFSLYLMVPAHPFAEPSTSEFEKPPTATSNCTSLKSSLPEVKSVM